MFRHLTQSQAPTGSALAVVNLAPAAKSKSFLLLPLFLFIAITAILATPRALPRLQSFYQQLRLRPSTGNAPALFTSPALVQSQHPLYTGAAMVPEKYRKPPQAPPLFTGTKESIVADAKKICDTTRSLLDKVVAEQTADKGTFNTVLLPQLEDENQADLSSRILGFYQYVSASEDLRGASTEAEKVLDEFNIECNMREDVFKLVEGVYNRRNEATDLDPESLHLLEKEYKGYIKNGLGLPAGEKRDRFKEIKKRLSQISIEFQKNLNEENGGIWFTSEQLEGVPEDVVNTLEKGTGENEGKLRLTFKYPDMFPTLKFAVNPETRREVFTQSENKVIPRCFPFHMVHCRGLLSNGDSFGLDQQERPSV